MTPTDFVLIFLIVGYFTSIIRQSWLSTRIDDLKHDNDRLRRDVERDVEVLETEIAREAGNRRSTCTQWHREANTRLWTLENQRDTAPSDDLDIPDTDTHSIPDKEHTPCPTTSATHSPASDAPSYEQPETSSDASPTASTPSPTTHRTPSSPSPSQLPEADTSPSTTAPPDTRQTSTPCENSTDAPGAPGTPASPTTSTGTGE